MKARITRIVTDWLPVILVILAILIASKVRCQYVRIPNQLKQKNDLSFPIVDSYDLKGGAMSGSDRTAVDVSRRVRGQLFLDSYDDKLYQLIGGITDDKWTELGVWTRSSTAISYSAGNVGIGKSPGVPLDVNGSVNIPNDSSYRIGGIKFFTLGYNGSGSNYVIGEDAMSGKYWVNWTKNIVIGEDAMKNMTNSITGGNVAIGYQALRDYSGVGYNVAIGGQAQCKAGNTYDNVAIGYNSMAENLIGNENTCIGYHTMYQSVAGDNNTFIGHGAGQRNNGSYNVGIGTNALGVNSDIKTGSYNTSIGSRSGFSNTTGTRCVYIGYEAAYSVASGDDLFYLSNSSTNNLITGSFASPKSITIWGALNISDKTAVSSADSALFREGNKTKYAKTDAIEDNNITWTGNHIFNNAVCLNNLYEAGYSADLVDDGTINFTASVAGWGFIMAGDNDERAEFSFTSAGVVTLGDQSTNVANSDSDGNLCVYDGGAYIIIKNRLGSTKKIRYKINYSAQ